MNAQYITNVRVTPKEVLAGDSTEITVSIIIGSDFVAKGSRIVLDMPAYLGYSRPSRYDQESNGYIEIFCSNPDIEYLERVWNLEAGEFTTKQTINSREMAQRLFVIDFLEGSPEMGDEIQVKWGYTRHGIGVGAKICTIVPEREFYNTIHVRYFTDGSRGLPDFGRSFKSYDRPVPDAEFPVSYRVMPRQPESLRLIRKHDKANLLVLDRFSNICDVSSADEFVCESIPAVQNSHGVFEIPNPGIILKSKNLPLFSTPDMSNVFDGMNIYFGDLHTHSVFSNDCIEREKMEMTPDKMFKYAKNGSSLDFLAVTDHHKPWHSERSKIGIDHWRLLYEAVEANTEDGSFLAFPGFEYQDDRGDTGIIFNEYIEYSEIDTLGLVSIKLLWERLKGRDYIGIPHFHNGGRLNPNQWYECPYEGAEPVMEIYSCHGSFESGNILERRTPLSKTLRADRNGRYFLDNGYRYGIICNSDGHKGNPGVNGLTAVYSRELSKKSIFEAIRKRHVYGTTNARIRLLFTLNGQLMGSVLTDCEEKTLQISIQGENRLKAVDIIHNGEVIKRYKPGHISFDAEYIIHGHDPGYYYVRATQIDNHIAYSSPVWLV